MVALPCPSNDVVTKCLSALGVGYMVWGVQVDIMGALVHLKAAAWCWECSKLVK
jgi:hypothetical protein